MPRFLIAGAAGAVLGELPLTPCDCGRCAGGPFSRNRTADWCLPCGDQLRRSESVRCLDFQSKRKMAPLWEPFVFNGANERIRTADLRITSALLYQLSHIGKMQFRRTRRLIITKASNLHKDFFQHRASSCAGVTRKTKRNAAKVNATLRFILQILFKTVAVTFARRRF